MLVLIFVIGAIVMALVSLAALIDPFAWMPSIGEIWEDCAEDYDTPENDCELASRFPGFWWHVVANLAYQVVAVGLMAWLAMSVSELREAKIMRFSEEGAAERHARARAELALAAILSAILGALAIVVAVG